MRRRYKRRIPSVYLPRLPKAACGFTREPVPCVDIQWMAHVYLIRTVSVRSVVNPVHMNTPSGKVLMNPIISWSVNSAVIPKKKSTKLANLQTVKNIAPLAVIP